MHNITLKEFWDKRSQNECLMEWDRLKKLVSETKDIELEFRKYIVSRAFPQREEGTNTVELGNGYELKVQVKYNYKLDPDNAKIDAALDRMAKLGNEGSFVADRLVNWSASLSLTEYRTLEPQYKKIIDEVLTITEAAPTLVIKEPKAKK